MRIENASYRLNSCQSCFPSRLPLKQTHLWIAKDFIAEGIDAVKSDANRDSNQSLTRLLTFGSSKELMRLRVIRIGIAINQSITHLWIAEDLVSEGVDAFESDTNRGSNQ